MSDEVKHRHGVHDPHYRHLAIAVHELLVEKGVLSEDRIDRQIVRMDARSPADGARMVARAWTDQAYRARMLADGSAAAEEIGLVVDGTLLVAVENTDAVHNLFVCTLCSCYPRSILGLPPNWYKAPEYRRRVVREPRKVLAEFGVSVADDVELRVHDSTADMRYIVLPCRPDGTEGWSKDALAKLVTRDSMIGVGLPLSPQTAQAAE
ncbi:MAG: nitrile hydratase subunit alpha [Alphaproteobacteria bacterium]|nr:nitrile hydratase subunit alpha [Alphaproteobacteria bacterium]